MTKRASMRGTVLRPRSVEEKAGAVEAFARDVGPGLAARRVRAIVDSVFPAGEAAAAFERLEGRGKFGKVLLDYGSGRAGCLRPVAVAISFVDCINRGDVDALGRLMTDDHTLEVFDEAPLIGRRANVDAWRGYTERFPSYVIHPRHLAAEGGDCRHPRTHDRLASRSLGC